MLTALLSIVRGNSSIVANKEGGDYSKRLKISLQQCKIPMKEYFQIDQAVRTASNFYRIHSGTLVGGLPSTLCNLPDIVGEFLFFDDEEMILISLDQAKILKALHK